MKLSKTKKQLLELIDTINNPDDLLAIQIFIDTHILNKGLPVLSEWQLKRIEESEKQIERGEFYTEEEANKEIEDWLNSLPDDK